MAVGDKIKYGEYYVKLTKRQKIYLKFKFVADIIISAAALIVLLPLLLIICILQKNRLSA